MKVKPVKRQNVLVRLAKISKAQKQAAKAAAAEAKLAAQAAQGTDTFVKPGFKAKMKTPKFRNWTIGIVAALGAITTGAIFSRPKTYDAPLAARMQAYAEYRDYTQSEANSFVDDYMTRSAGYQEHRAVRSQDWFDYQAFMDVLEDNGFEEASDTVSKDLPSFYTDEHNGKKILNEKLRYLRNNMTTREYQKFVNDSDFKSTIEDGIPYYNNVLCQYTLDSIAFRKYLDKTGLVHNRGVMRDFENICKAIKPRYYDYFACYNFHSYRPFYEIDKDGLLKKVRRPYSFFK